MVDYQVIREARLREPFRPFVLTTTSGRRFHIGVPEHLAVAPWGLGVIDRDTEAGVLVLMKEVASLTYVDETSERSA